MRREIAFEIINYAHSTTAPAPVTEAGIMVREQKITQTDYGRAQEEEKQWTKNNQRLDEKRK